MSHLFTPIEHGVLRTVVIGWRRQAGVAWIARAGVEPYFDLAAENLDTEALAERTLQNLRRRGLVYARTWADGGAQAWWATDLGERTYRTTLPDAYSEGWRSRLAYVWYWCGHGWGRLSYLEWCWERCVGLLRTAQMAARSQYAKR